MPRSRGWLTFSCYRNTAGTDYQNGSWKSSSLIHSYRDFGAGYCRRKTRTDYTSDLDSSSCTVLNAGWNAPIPTFKRLRIIGSHNYRVLSTITDTECFGKVTTNLRPLGSILF